MANPIQNNQYYQAPLQVPSYVSNHASVIPSQPVTDVYGLFGVVPKGKVAPKKKNPYETLMDGGDVFQGLIPDAEVKQTNLATLDPLDDPAGVFHSQDGFGKYGYSTILNDGDNEDRYSRNFKKDNPHLFWREGFHPWEGIQKGVYWGGGFLEKTLESAVVKTGQGIAGIYGLTVGNVIGLKDGGYDNFADWLSRSTDNMFSNFFNGWDENLKERYHYFQEKSDRDKKGFIASLSDGDFWMNDISDGLGFLVSAAFEAGLVSKLGLGTKAASRIAPLAEGVPGATAVAQGAGQASKLARVANAIGIEGGGHTLVKNAVDLTTQTMALTAIESAVEANETKKHVYKSFEGKINPETGMYYTEEEKQRLSAAAAAQVFQQNMTVLIAPKFLETMVFNRIGKAFKGFINKGVGEADTAAGQASRRVRSRVGNFNSSTETLGKASALRSVFKVGSAASIGFMSEGLFEENIQLAISREAQQAFGADDEFYRPGTSKADIDRMESEDELFGDVSRRYWNQTKRFFKGITDDRFIDDELSKSVGIGGMFGVGGGTVHSVIGIRQQAKVDHYWNTRLNAATANLFESQNFFKTETVEKVDPNDPTKKISTNVPVIDPKTGQPMLDDQKLKAFLNKMNNIQGLMEIINNTEDPNDEANKLHQNKELNKLARNVLFTQLAMEYIRAGKKDTLLANLASTSGFSDKDIQALGYEPGMMSESDKKMMLAKMNKIVEKLAKSDAWIEDNVIDNVSESRQGFGGVRYSKTQKEKRRQEFEAKKAYLRGLAMQNALLDTYLDDIAEAEAKLDQTTPEIMSSTLDENGMPVVDYSANLSPVTREWNSKIPALKNHIGVLQREFAYHWDNVLSHERTSPKAGRFGKATKSGAGKNLAYSQVKADEALERINELQAELDKLEAERNAFLRDNDNFELVQEEGNFYALPKALQKSSAQITLEQLQAEKVRRINKVKQEEIAIQKNWLDKEWQNTAALKEEKTKAGREETYFSRRMSASKNAYNTFFQREVMGRDDSLGQRRLKLYDKDEAKRINAKKYKANEEKLLKAVRIQGKVTDIIADINGQKLIAEIEALLERDLPSGEFATELKAITDSYNGKAVIVKAEDKTLVDEQIEALEEERDFASNLLENWPDDERFNEKYYNLDSNGEIVEIKPEFDDMQVMAGISRELNDKIEDLEKIKAYLESIPTEIKGDWSNVNKVKKRITEPYTETADSIIDSYNQASNDGQSELSGDILSTKQDLDRIDYELDELGQLKAIFEERHKTDMILATPEFAGFIESLDKRIAELKKIREVVKERMASRLRENQDFLIDAVSNFTEQLGLNFDGTTMNPPLHDEIEKIVGKETMDKLKKALTDLKELSEKPDQTAEDKKAVVEAYWGINGHVAAIQELIKANNEKSKVAAELAKQKTEAIAKIEQTAVMQKIKDKKYSKDILKNINTSLLGALQILFYQSEFSQVGLAGGGDNSFLDDQPSSPVYRFREDYNLRKLVRGVERDESRTPENTEISREDLVEFLKVAKHIQNLEDLEKTLASNLNLLDQIEVEKSVVKAKMENKGKEDNQYDNLIVSSIQQIFFIRAIASFLRRETGIDGFKNWTYVQAPGGSGKTQTLGTWFNIVSGIPRDRVIATAFTEEASRGIKKALLVGEDGPKDAAETADFIKQLTKDKKFDHDVLIIDEFPAIDIITQKNLLLAIQEYSEAKKQAGKGEFKVVTMGDTNQLTFSDNGSVAPRPSIITNDSYFNDKKKPEVYNHPSQMTIIPSLTVNFRSNIFAVTSFIEQFKGSNKEMVNANLKVASTDTNLEHKDVKGVVSVSKSEFKNKIVNYIKKNLDSNRTRTLIVNETKIEEYKKLLTDNGIKIITDPNDELTKGGVYVTTVKNVQGFSFDEVFVDLENNDKTLFSGTSNLNYIYNKAMYVAASRARNLIVTTNFPNLENTEDESINSLESKSLTELQTKDDEFLANRESEINGAKEILGENYDKTRKAPPVQPAKTEKVEPVETPLDAEPVQTPEEKEAERAAEEAEARGEEPAPETAEEPEVEEEPLEEGEEDQTPSGPEVVSTIEDETEQDEEMGEEDETKEDVEKGMMARIKDELVTAFDKIKSGIIELLYPTGQTIKYKIKDGDFTINPRRLAETPYENKALQNDDKVILIPFRQQHAHKSNRRFGYAIVTPAIGQDGQEIPNEYRTVSVLSDREIDRFKNNVDTKKIYDLIQDNEKGSIEFVTIKYDDLYDENGFRTGGTKVIRPLVEGRVTYTNPIKYFYRGEYKEMDGANMERIINNFINSFYRNMLEDLSPEERLQKLNELRNFYNNPRNARIVIPTNPDVIETPRRKPRLNVPPELVNYVRPGRPYLVFRPFHERSTMQFIGLSRKFLNGREHNHLLEPIEGFMRLGKSVKATMQSKGIQDRFGYSRPLAGLISRVAEAYRTNPNNPEYSFPFTSIVNGEEVTKTVKFNNIEAERIRDLFNMYSVPATDFVHITTEEQIKAITDRQLPDGTYQRKRARTLIFEEEVDGTPQVTTIIGTIQSYNPSTRTYEVRESRTGNVTTKSGTLRTSGRASTGAAQQAMNNIMSANGHIAKNFTSGENRVGFVTMRGGTTNVAEARYNFMALLGSKQSAVPKTFRENGEVKEYYEDIFDILDDLFTFDSQRQLMPKNINYINNQGQIDSMEVKFRVPVPLKITDGDPNLRHDYTNTDDNTSRESTVNNSRYFETNFDDLIASKVMVEFEEEVEVVQPEPETQEEEVTEEPEVTVEEKEEEEPVQKLDELTKEEIKTIPFSEIRSRMTPAQEQTLTKFSQENGFGDLNSFFSEAESAFPEEQEMFRDYIIDCII